MSRSRRILFVGVACVVGCLYVDSPRAWGQTPTATLTGVVVDEANAVVPDVAIVLTNDATALKREIATNREGFFTVPLLPPGSYTLRAKRDGFTPAEISAIVLNVNDQVALRIQLKVASLNESVTVTAGPSRVNTSPAVGTVIDRTAIENAPMNGRSFQTLLGMVPGVNIVPVGNSAGEGGQISVNGQRTNANVFLVDGLNANAGVSTAPTNAGQAGSGQLPALTALGSTASLVSVDALQEFRIETSSYAPEFGRQPGGQILLTTRSGTNNFHGSAFDYIRNEIFDANDWFNNRDGRERPATRQNLFGVTFGGPVILPKVYNGRNRSFFFFSYEGLRLRQPKTITNRTVPSMAMRQSPPTGSAFLPYLNAFPVPNSGATGFSASYSDPSQYDTTSLRVDHTQGRHTLFGRVSVTPSKSTVRNTANLSNLTHTNVNYRSYSVGWTWSAFKSGRVVNDLRANYATTEGPVTGELDNFGGAVPLTTFGFQGRSPSNSQFSVTYSSLPLRWGLLSDFEQRQTNIVDNLNVALGDHQLKFGVDYRRNNPVAIKGGAIRGLEALIVSPANVTSNTVTFFINQILGNGTTDISAAFENLGVYAQDTWRAAPRLTLTYGLRWELVPPPYATSGNDPAVLDGLEQPFAPGHVRLAAPGTPLWETRYANFVPRIGASYLAVREPGRELVIRGGGGLFHDLGLGFSAESFALSYPNSATRTFPLDTSCGTAIPFPLTSCFLVPPVVGSTPPGALFAMPDIRPPRTYQWNFSVEQSLGANQSVTATYVGAEGRDLLKHNRYIVNLADSPTTRSTVNVQRNQGYSDYRALQLQFQRRLNRGFQTLVAYTFARSRDTNSTDTGLGSNIAPAERAPIDLDYGYSDFDVRHNLTANMTYLLPRIRGNSIFEAVTRDWALNAIFRFRTALPFNPRVTAVFVSGVDVDTFRPNVIPGVPVWIEDPKAPGGRRLNNSVPTGQQIADAGCSPRTATTPAIGAFCTAAGNLQGNAPRNFLRGFPARQVDLSVRREFPSFQKVRVQIRLDVFNVTNTPNFASPASDLEVGTALFGQSTSMLNRNLGGLNALYQIGGPRSMQWSARILF